MKKTSLSLCIAAFAFGIPSAASAQTNLRIYGALSNFDCYNDSPDDCDGFEIEIEGLHKEDVIHTWDYSSLGAPTVTDSFYNGGPSALIRYKSATSVVHPNGVTHFGVTLATFVDPGKIHRSWLSKTPFVPPIPVPLLSHRSQVVISGNKTMVRDVLTNDELDNGLTYWILPYVNVVHREVTLDELMSDNPLITGSRPLGDGSNGKKPIQLDPGDAWFDDDGAGDGLGQSVAYTYEVYRDIVGYVNGEQTHRPGALIGKIMDASLASSAVPAAPDFSLSNQGVYGGAKDYGTVTIDALAGGSGAFVNLSSDNAAAEVPAKVTIPSEMSQVDFIVKTVPVAIDTTVHLKTTVGGVSKTIPILVKAPDLSKLSLSSGRVKGGTAVTGTLKLTSIAPAGGMTLSLSSDSPSVTVPATVVVPAGSKVATFSIATHPVSASTAVMLHATLQGISKGVTIKLDP